MRNPAFRALATAAAILLAVTFAIVRATAVPDVSPATAAVDAFSGARAMAHVREIARTPHPVGSAGARRVRDYLRSELAHLGVPAEVQATTGIGTRYQVAGRVENVVARLRGREPGPAVLLLAHYDAVPASYGAADDGAGSATIVEVLRALGSGAPLRHDVIALFADGEESGLLGAAAFVREHPWAKDIALTINIEARGTHGPSLMFETGPGNLDVARVLRGAPGARATSLSTAVYRRLPNDTDLSELMRLGTPALNFAFIGGVDRYHTSEDDAAHLDARSVQHHGDQVLAVVRTLAEGPLPRPKTGDAVFFDLPGAGLVVYPESWAVPLAVLGVLLAVAALVVARRREERWLRGAVAGLAATVAASVLAALAGLIVTTLLSRVHAMIGSGRVDVSGSYAAVIALLAFATMAAAYGLARIADGPVGIHAGAILTWAVLSLAVAVALPGGSFLFTWPLLFVGIAFLIAESRPGGRMAIAAYVIAGLVAVLVVAPIAYLMGSVALGLEQGAPIVALLTALTTALLAPALRISGERSWWPASAPAAAAVLLAAAGVATTRTNGDHPVGTTITYAIDADSGAAWLTGSAQTAAARRWLDAELSAMVGGAATGVGPAWLGNFGGRRGVPAPAATVARAVVHVVRDSLTDSSRVVTLHVVPAAGTASVAMRAGGVLAWSVDGRRVDTARFRRRLPAWAMEYVAPPLEGFSIELALRADSHPVLELAARQPGLPAIDGLRVPRRPAGLLPIQRGDVTLTYQRVPLQR